MSTTSNRHTPHIWAVHDLVAGAIAGAAIGFAASTIVRAPDSRLPMVLLSAVASIVLLRRERRRRPGIGPTTIAVWALGTLSVALIALIVYALARFE